MNKIKDFFYNTNDILIALLILVCAGALIVWRIDAIMDYPRVVVETATVAHEKAIDKDAKKDAKSDKTEKGEKTSTKSSKAKESLWNDDGTLKKGASVTIPEGNAEGAYDALVESGLFSSADDFINACEEYGYSVESLKAGKFDFDAGTSKEVVIDTMLG